MLLIIGLLPGSRELQGLMVHQRTENVVEGSYPNPRRTTTLGSKSHHLLLLTLNQKPLPHKVMASQPAHALPSGSLQQHRQKTEPLGPTLL